MGVFALQMVLAHTLSLASLVAVCTALAVLGIVAGAPTDGAAGGDEGTPAGGDAGSEISEDATRDGLDDGGSDADGSRRAAGGGDDPDDDDPDADLPEDIRNDPKRLRTHLRRTQRQFGRVRPIAERFRDPATGQYMQPQQIDRVLGRAQDMEELETFFNDHPDVVQLIMEKRRGGRGAAAAEDAFVDPFANPADLPWDTETPEGKKFLELFRDGAKSNHELRTQIKRLEKQLGQVDQRDTARTIGGIEANWKTQTLEAAKKVPQEYRETFVNSVWRSFELAKTRRQLGKVRVDQVLERELKPYVRASRGAQRTNVAGAQQRAEHNTTIPRPGARGSTSAAGPADSNKGVGTIRDGKKSFFARLGMAPTR